VCDDGADQIIRWSTAGAVVGVAAVAAVASYEHAYALVRVHGESGWMARLVPFTVDGLIYASSMMMLDSARSARSSMSGSREHNEYALTWLPLPLSRRVQADRCADSGLRVTRH
jgi:hypothetical protein